MRIGINALYLLPGKVGGSETYVRNLVRWMEQCDDRNEYILLVNRESEGVFKPSTERMKILLCPFRAVHRPVRILWEQFILPFQIKSHDIEVLLSAGMTAPFLCPATSVVVAYDLQHLHQPQNFAKFYLFFLKWILYLSAKTADGILTISHKVKEDIVRFYNVPPERVGVTYLGIDPEVFRPRGSEEVSCIRKKYSLPPRFILYPAATLPHKNHQRLFQAFRIVREQSNDLKLVLIGARDKGGVKIKEQILESGLREEDVLFLGWLPFEDIPSLYCAAELFVFPSLSEGFGMPIIEAMGCGVPVVCSEIEPLPEVAGDAARFVDPYDPLDISRGIQDVLRDSVLREKLVARGFNRAREFTWRDTALKTLLYLKSQHSRTQKSRA